MKRACAVFLLFMLSLSCSENKKVESLSSVFNLKISIPANGSQINFDDHSTIKAEGALSLVFRGIIVLLDGETLDTFDSKSKFYCDSQWRRLAANEPFILSDGKKILLLTVLEILTYSIT